MTSLDQTIDNGVYHIVMRREKLAARGANLDADLVLRRHKRTPGFGNVRLVGRGQQKAIDHCANYAWIGLVILNRVGIVDFEDDRRSRSGRWRLLAYCTGNGANQNKGYLSDRQDEDEFMSPQANNNYSPVAALYERGCSRDELATVIDRRYKI